MTNLVEEEARESLQDKRKSFKTIQSDLERENSIS